MPSHFLLPQDNLSFEEKSVSSLRPKFYFWMKCLETMVLLVASPSWRQMRESYVVGPGLPRAGFTCHQIGSPWGPQRPGWVRDSLSFPRVSVITKEILDANIFSNTGRGVRGPSVTDPSMTCRSWTVRLSHVGTEITLTFCPAFQPMLVKEKHKYQHFCDLTWSKCISHPVRVQHKGSL